MKKLIFSLLIVLIHSASFAGKVTIPATGYIQLTDGVSPAFVIAHGNSAYIVFSVNEPTGKCAKFTKMIVGDSYYLTSKVWGCTSRNRTANICVNSTTDAVANCD